MRKCGLYLLSFAVLSTSLSVFFSGVSSAASDYDEVYKKTPTLNLSYSGQCDTDVNITNDWYTRILATPESQWSGGSSGYKESLQNAIENGGRWGASQVYYYTSGNVSQKSVYIYWTEDTSLNLSWSTSQVTANGNNRKSIEIINAKPVGYPSCDDFYIQRAGGSYATVSKINDGYQEIKNNLLNIDDANRNIPFGYEGEPIFSGASSSVLPDIDYEVVGKTIKFKYNGQNVPFTPCSANWMITKTNYQPDDFESNTFLGTIEDAWGGWQDLIGASSANDSNNHVLDFRYKKSVSEQQTYTVDEYGTYYIALGLNTHWEGAPRLDCGDSGDEEDFEYDVRLKVVALKIDGTAYSGTTEGSECGASGGFCDGFAGANGANPIMKALQSLTNIETFGLQAFLLAPINFVASLPSMANTCSPISFPLFGSNIQLQCLKPLYYSWSLTVMTIYTTLINAVVVYAVATKIFETIRNVSAPDKDRIEVVKL